MWGSGFGVQGWRNRFLASESYTETINSNVIHAGRYTSEARRSQRAEASSRRIANRVAMASWAPPRAIAHRLYRSGLPLVGSVAGIMLTGINSAAPRIA